MQRYRFIIKSEQSSVLRIDGKHIGTIGISPLVLSCPIKDNYFFETSFTPSSGVVYRKNEFLFCPDNVVNETISDVKVIKLSSDTYILTFYATKTNVTGVFQPLDQQIYVQQGISHVATLYSDGIIFAELECDECIIKKHINVNITNPKLEILHFSENSLASVSGKYFDKTYLLITAFNGEDYIKVGEFLCDSFVNENNLLIIEKTHEDMLKHKVKTHYSFDGNTLKEDKKDVSNLISTPPKHDELRPYAFLEAVKAGFAEEALSYLNKDSFPNAEFIQLSNFFGDIDQIIQNIYSLEKSKYIAVTKKVKDNYFETTYYNFSLKGNLIDNIISV